MTCKYFLSFFGLSFYFLDCVLCKKKNKKQKTFNFVEVQFICLAIYLGLLTTKYFNTQREKCKESNIGGYEYKIKGEFKFGIST